VTVNFIILPKESKVIKIAMEYG